MNGKSSAHQASPKNGTQISSFFRKNFSMGIFRFKMVCNAKISTQDWWLERTRYHSFFSNFSSPLISQSILQNSFELKELIPIQRVAMNIRILSRTITKEWTGIINLKKEIIIKGMVRKMVFTVYNNIDKTPLRGWGKK